jgi:hypothetical protein
MMIQMACLCKENGELQPWFKPLKKLNEVRTQGWILRLSGASEDTFTLEVFTATKRIGRQIEVLPNGKYLAKTKEKDKREFETLVEVLRVHVPSMYQLSEMEGAIMPDSSYFSECLSHWSNMTKEVEREHHGIMYETNSSTIGVGENPRRSSSPYSDEVIDPRELKKQLHDLEWKLQLVLDFVMKKNRLTRGNVEDDD